MEVPPSDITTQLSGLTLGEAAAPAGLVTPSSTGSALTSPGLISPEPVYVPPQLGFEHTIPIRFYEAQLEHFHFIYNVLQQGSYYFDASETGTGKTYIAGGLAQTFKAKMLIICPAKLRARWVDFITEYRIPCHAILSYEEVTGQNNRGGVRQPKSGFLFRGKDKDSFQVTDEFIRRLSERMLIVFDEAHHLHNKSARFYGCRALIMNALNAGTARIGFLSATPIEKLDHAFNILRLLGIFNEEKMSTKGQIESFILKGALEVINSARADDPGMTDDILNPYGGQYGIRNNDEARDVCFQLFKNVTYGLRYSSMAMPIPIEVYNYFIYLDTEEIKVLAEGLEMLKKAARWNEEARSVGEGGQLEVGGIGAALAVIHAALSTAIARVAAEYLNNNPEHKVVIFTDHIEALNRIHQALAAFNPLVISGHVSQETRSAYVAAFEQFNLKYRVFISTTSTGGEGIDLDDKSLEDSEGPAGRFPRAEFITPNYSLTKIIQALGRIRRMSTTSLPRGYVCYPANYQNDKLLSILAALARKGEIMEQFTVKRGRRKKTIEEEEDEEYRQSIYPDTYPSLYEEVPPQSDAYHIYPPRM